MNANAKNDATHEAEYGPDGELLKSKTQLKQDSEDLKKLGLELVNLSTSQLNEIALDDQLREAVLLAGRINKKKDGYRRQLQLIGKMLRSREPEPIVAALEKLNAHHLVANNFFHKIEALRDKILANGDSAIQELVNEHPHLDRQKLRTWQRQALKQAQGEATPKAAREIFQYLKQNIEA